MTRCSPRWPMRLSAGSEPITISGCCSPTPASISQPRPYRLADLADAAGMSLSGIRTAYTQADIDRAAQLTGGARSRHLLAVITSLLIGGRNAAERHGTAA